MHSNRLGHQWSLRLLPELGDIRTAFCVDATILLRIFWVHIKELVRYDLIPRTATSEYVSISFYPFLDCAATGKCHGVGYHLGLKPREKDPHFSPTASSWPHRAVRCVNARCKIIAKTWRCATLRTVLAVRFIDVVTNCLGIRTTSIPRKLVAWVRFLSSFESIRIVRCTYRAHASCYSGDICSRRVGVPIGR